MLSCVLSRNLARIQSIMAGELAAKSLYDRASETAQALQHELPEGLRKPKVAIVCGSGLGGLQQTINDGIKFEKPYADIPNWARSTGQSITCNTTHCVQMLIIHTVQGHEGKLVFGTIGANSTPVMLLVGRAHFYEGHSMETCTFATRVIKLMGCETVIVTNAAGGLNQDFSVGDIMILSDHLNIPGMVGASPLHGPNEERFGVRFPPLSDAYDLELRRRAWRAWAKLGLDKAERRLHEGTYAFLAGPTYETRAECRMLRMLGADVVGMSTVPEIVVARHSGLRVLAFSLVTNKAVLQAGPAGNDPEVQSMSEAELTEYLSRGRANHEEVLEAGRLAAQDMQALVKQILEDLYV